MTDSTSVSTDSPDLDAALGSEPAPRTRIKVRGRSSHGPSAFDKMAHGHWRAGMHWSSTETNEREVTMAEFDELVADPYLVLLYDERELAEVRAYTDGGGPANELELEAARLEAEAATLRAQAISKRASEDMRRANEEAAAARMKQAALEERKGSGR